VRLRRPDLHRQPGPIPLITHACLTLFCFFLERQLPSERPPRFKPLAGSSATQWAVSTCSIWKVSAALDSPCLQPLHRLQFSEPPTVNGKPCRRHHSNEGRPQGCESHISPAAGSVVVSLWNRITVFRPLPESIGSPVAGQSRCYALGSLAW